MIETKLESCVIVTNPRGAVATIRFNTEWKDRIISASNKQVLYTLVEKYIKKTLNG